MNDEDVPVDVCIVCALSEEARAVREVLRAHSAGAVEERIGPRYGYSYRLATITNAQGESLSVHLSWLPRYGPVNMTLHLEHVLEEYQPRIVVMTGICAGDAAHVHLGDLVVAERTFTYDNGKYVLDELGHQIHEHDTLTYQLDANILQFLGLFDEWEPLVARLRRPTSPLELRRHKVAHHIKAMASGSAVRTDNPFAEVQASVRGTVAIDMEGAAFGLVMSRHPLIPWLIVKGVSDYADQAKNDTYHGYAARASALYALSFIRAYVTSERLPPFPERKRRTFLHRLFAPLTDGLIGLPGSPLSGVEQFLREYLGTPERSVPFGGRQEQLATLDRWLSTPGQPYGLLVAEAGRGKSALLTR